MAIMHHLRDEMTENGVCDSKCGPAVGFFSQDD
jgi:hypothetical protein